MPRDSFCVAGAVFGEVGVWVFVAGAAFGDILGDSRSTKCCIFQYKIVSKIGRVRSPKRRARDDDFMVGSSSDHPRIIFGLSSDLFESSFYWRKQFTEFALKSWTYRFRLQAQYLVRLEVDFACSAHWKWRFIWDAHQSWDSFCVAGAVFGEVGLSLFVAGAAFGDILGDSRSAKRCIFQYKIVSKIGRVRSPKRRVRDDDFIFGSCSDYPRIVFILAEAIQRVSAAILNLKISWQAQYLLRLEVDIACSAHWKWSFIWDADQTWDSFCVAGAVFAEVGAYVTRINHEMHFAWQAQYLVRFEVDFACSAHSKWRFICDADQSWDSFCVAGAEFGEVGGWLFVAGTGFRDILGDSRSAKCCIFQYKIVSKIGRVRSPKRRVRDDDFIFGSCSGYPRIVFILAEAIQRVSAAIFNLKISWQAQYLLRLEVDIACSAHWKWSFIWDADQTWDSFCVAGAVFAEVGGWHCLLRAF